MTFTIEHGRQWRERYEAGETYEEIANDVGAHPRKVRDLVIKAGGQSRPQGMRAKTKKNNPTGIGVPDPGIKVVHRPGASPAKRRRGWRSRINPSKEMN